MLNYLKIIQRDSSLFNKDLGAMVLKTGDIIPAIMNAGNLYVEASGNNEKCLFNNDIGYMLGTLSISGSVIKFTPKEPHNKIQIFIGLEETIEIDYSRYGIKEEEVAADLGLNMEIFDREVSRFFGTYNIEVFGSHYWSPKLNGYSYDLYHSRPGYVKGVELIHDNYGIVRIVVKKDLKLGKVKVIIEPKYRSYRLKNINQEIED